jgi:hypothetical protein
MKPVDERTLVPGMMDEYDNDGTMINHSQDTLRMNSGTLESNLGTMVINSDGEDDDFTMKRK